MTKSHLACNLPPVSITTMIGRDGSAKCFGAKWNEYRQEHNHQP
jgi:hypothetical protein